MFAILENNLNNDNNDNNDNNNNNNANNNGAWLEPLPLLTQKRRELVKFNNSVFRIYKSTDSKDYMQCIFCKRGTATRDRYADGGVGQCQLGTIDCLPTCISDFQCFERRELIRLAQGEFTQNLRTRRPVAIEEAKQKYTMKYGPAPLVVQGPVAIPKSSMYRARATLYPNIPHSFLDLPLVLPQACCEVLFPGALHAERFVWVNEAFQDKRIIALATLRDLIQLSNAHHIYVDGTFKISPKPFEQVFSFNSMVGPTLDRSALIQRVVFLLPGKSAPLYLSVFEMLLETLEMANALAGRANAPISWQSITSDFESGIIAAVKSAEFDPHRVIALRGCWFHHVKAVLDALTKPPVSLSVAYRAPNGTLRPFMKLLFALPFCALADVRDTYHAIVANDLPEEYRMDPRIDHFLNYYYNTWINNEARQAMCNLHQRPDRRTNNDLEGYHQKLNRSIPPHPNLWLFIESMKKIFIESRDFERRVLTNPNGAIAARAPQMITKDERLTACVQMYNNHMYASPREYVHALREWL